MARTTHSLLSQPAKSYKFDLQFFQKFWYLSRRYLSDGNGSFNETMVLFTFVLLLSVVEQYLIYNIGMITSVYYKIMGNKDLDQFLVHTLKCIFLVTSMAIVKSSKEYVSSSLQIMWRENLTKKLHEIYFSGHSFYSINVLPPASLDDRDKVDNPDQRITQDVSEFSKYLSSTVPSLLIAPFSIGWYSYKSFVTTGYIGPLGCFTFFLISTVVNKYLLSPIVNLVYQQERAEGHFRFRHVNVRSNAESIAFMSGGPIEKDISNRKLDELLGVQSKIILKQLFLGLSVNFTGYIGSIISFIILAVPLFAGSFNDVPAPELAQLISANVFVSITLIYSFTSLVDLSSTLSIIAGTTHRIHQLVGDLEMKLTQDLGDETRDGDTTSMVDPNVFFRLTDVTLSRPSNELCITDQLIKELSLEMSSGGNILIWGPSGSGKTAILRLLKGLWKQTCGSVEFCDPNQFFFLPQKPVMACSSLKQQLIYPKSVQERNVTSEGDLLDFLKLFDLTHLLDRVDGDWDKDVPWSWSDVLSPGELQRVSFVRVLFHRPKLVLLDEATSSVSNEIEKLFYEQLKLMKVTYVTCGHQPSLWNYHESILEIKNKKCRLRTLTNQSTTF